MQLGKEKIKHLYGALVTYLIAAKNTWQKESKE